jgi:DnaJ-class molecular chaperone
MTREEFLDALMRRSKTVRSEACPACEANAGRYYAPSPYRCEFCEGHGKVTLEQALVYFETPDK